MLSQLLISHKQESINSIIVPGSGKGSFDSFEDNPFETKKQRMEREVNKVYWTSKEKEIY